MSNPRVTRAILEVVDNQICDEDPPETKVTYDRLIAQGHADDEARRLIAAVVATEIFDVVKGGKPFNLQRFVTALRACGRDVTSGPPAR